MYVASGDLEQLHRLTVDAVIRNITVETMNLSFLIPPSPNSSR